MKELCDLKYSRNINALSFSYAKFEVLFWSKKKLTLDTKTKLDGVRLLKKQKDTSNWIKQGM